MLLTDSPNDDLKHILICVINILSLINIKNTNIFRISMILLMYLKNKSLLINVKQTISNPCDILIRRWRGSDRVCDCR